MNNFFGTLYGALTYTENWTFVLINYIILAGVILIYLLTKLKKLNPKWWLITLLATILQMIFWVMLRAQGISIIWNAVAGMLVIDYFRFRIELQLKVKIQIWIVFLLVISGDLYFAIITPLITSIAHCSAIVMGLILRLIFNRTKVAKA